MAIMLLITAITITAVMVIKPLLFALTDRIAMTDDNNMTRKILIKTIDLKQFR